MGAPKTFYLKDAAASGSSHGSLQDGGSAPAGANTNTRWTPGTVAATAYARMVYNTAVASGSFGATAQPNSTPTTTDSWRSENQLSGKFTGSQSWALSVELLATGSNSIASGRLRVRVTKGTAVDGSNAVDTDGGQWSTTQVTTLNNTVSQIVTATITESNVTFSGEYLFLQCAWEIDSASASGLAALRIKVGSSSTLTTGTFVPLGEISSESDSVGGESGTLGGLGALSSSSAGVATETGTLVGSGALSSSSAGVGAEIATLVGRGALSGTAAGIGAESASLFGVGALSLSAAGVSTAVGTLAGFGALAGVFAGSSTVVPLLSGTGALSATFQGAGDEFGAIGGSGALALVTAGVGGFIGTVFDGTLRATRLPQPLTITVDDKELTVSMVMPTLTVTIEDVALTFTEVEG